MSPVRKASQLFRPFGRSCLPGNPGRLRNPSDLLARTLEDENRVSHSMQVTCFWWRWQTLGKRCHTGQVPFCSWLRKAGSVALAVYWRPVEPTYIRDLRNMETSRPSLSPGGLHGEY